MTDLKITVDQLKNYLGTGLELKTDFKTISGIKVNNPFFTMDAINLHDSFNIWTYDPEFCKHFVFIGKGFKVHQIKPACYRLSDLNKEIEVDGKRFVPIEEIQHYHNFSIVHTARLFTDPLNYPFTMVEKLFEWHFWPFGDEYFEQGLVIDKMKQK